MLALQQTFKPEQWDGWLYEDQSQNKIVDDFWSLRVKLATQLVIGWYLLNGAFCKTSVRAINVGKWAAFCRQQEGTGGSAISSPHLRSWHQGEMHTSYMKTFNVFLGSYHEMQLKRRGLSVGMRAATYMWGSDVCICRNLTHLLGDEKTAAGWTYLTKAEGEDSHCYKIRRRESENVLQINLSIGSLCCVSKINWLVIITFSIGRRSLYWINQ